MWIFNEINLQNVKGDVFGGVTATVITLPMAQVFGVITATDIKNDQSRKAAA